MHLSYLEAENVRCLSHIAIHPSPRINVLLGANASGKTSLLEAIYLLGRGRTFRKGCVSHLIRDGARRLVVFGRLAEEGIPLGISKGPQGTEIHLGGKPLRQTSELANRLPLRFINTNSHQLLEQGAKQRRRLMDWGVFYEEPRFLPAWQRYARAMRQRNQALRREEPLGPWDEMLEQEAVHLHAYRAGYVERLGPYFSRYAEGLLENPGVRISYRPGWPLEEGLKASLERSRERDRVAGYTTLGPHRADMQILWEGRQAQHWASSGQHKLLVCALSLAQVALLRERTGRCCLVLIDDLAAELDEVHRRRLLRALEALGSQVFLTGTDRGLLETQGKWFHVERGQVQES